jgi:hypothetical protein
MGKSADPLVATLEGARRAVATWSLSRGLMWRENHINQARLQGPQNLLVQRSMKAHIPAVITGIGPVNEVKP